jgi:UDP-glucose 4-epimerase
MNCLVTGGAGFIGSNLVDKLLLKGHKVIALDDKSSGSTSYWNDDAHNWEISVTNYSGLSNICRHYKPAWIFHLAAESNIQSAIEKPQDACMTNVIGTCNILQAAKECGARVMYSSTSAAYGLKNNPPLKEEMPTDCLNPYSVTKVSGEALCKMYYDLFNVETIIFRYFNVYGNRQRHQGQYAPVIGTFLNQHKSCQKLTVVGDGKQTRDYIHVDDVVSANILAAESKNKQAFGEIFNIGSGKAYNVLEIAEMISPNNIKYIPARLGEVKDSLCDNIKAKNILNWNPEGSVINYIKGELKNNV